MKEVSHAEILQQALIVVRIHQDDPDQLITNAFILPNQSCFDGSPNLLTPELN